MNVNENENVIKLLERQMESRDGTHFFSSPDWRVRMTVDRIYKSATTYEEYEKLVESTPSLKTAVNYFREKELNLLDRQLKSREEKHVFACPDWRIKSTLQRIQPIHNTQGTPLNTPNSSFCSDLPGKTYAIFKRCAQLSLIDGITEGQAKDKLNPCKEQVVKSILSDFSTKGGKAIDQGSIEYVFDVLYGTDKFNSVYLGLSEANKIALYRGVPEGKQLEFFEKITARGPFKENTSEGIKLYSQLSLVEQKGLYLKLPNGMQAAILRDSSVAQGVKEELLLGIVDLKERINLVAEANFSSPDTVQAFDSLSDKDKESYFKRLTPNGQVYILKNLSPENRRTYYPLVQDDKLVYESTNTSGRKHLLDNLSPEKQFALFSELDRASKMKVLTLLSGEQRSLLYPKMPNGEIVSIYRSMSGDGKKHLLDNLSPEKQFALFSELDRASKMEVLTLLSGEQRSLLYPKMPNGEIISIYSSMSGDGKKHLLEDLSPEKQFALFSELDRASKMEVLTLLSGEQRSLLYPKMPNGEIISIYRSMSGDGKKHLLEDLSPEKLFVLFSGLDGDLKEEMFQLLSEEQKASLLSSLPLVDKERFSPDILEASPASSSLVRQGGEVQAPPRGKSVKAESVVAGPESLKFQRVAALRAESAALRASIEASENKLWQDAVRNAETGIGDLVEKEVSRQLGIITSDARASREKSEARLREVKARKAAEKEAAKKKIS